MRRGWTWLLKQQDADGSFFHDGGMNHRYYTQGQCAIALCELYAMTKDDKLREPAERAIRYLLDSQSPMGGWKYQPRVNSDVSVTGWVVMALQSARMAGIEVPPEHFQRVERFLDQVAQEDGSRYPYELGRMATPAMTAEALLCRQYLGWARDDPRLVRGVDWITSPDNLINYDTNRNVYFWYYATQVAHHMEGEYWKRWNAVMRQAVPEQQSQARPRGRQLAAGRRRLVRRLAAAGSTSRACRSTCSKSTTATCRSTRACISAGDSVVRGLGRANRIVAFRYCRLSLRESSATFTERKTATLTERQIATFAERKATLVSAPGLNALPPGLEGDQGDADREVEASGLGPNGDPQAALGVGVEHPARQPLRFAAEHQRVARRKPRVGVRRRRGLRQKPEPRGIEPRAQPFPVVDDFPVEVFPVVHAGPTQPPIVDLKPERPNQPQLRADRHARPAGAAGVVGDLRLIKDDVERRVGHGGARRQVLGQCNSA